MPDQQLDQSAIDSLFTTGGAHETLETVDFAERRSITAEQMHQLTSLNLLFSRQLTAKLSAWLGVPMHVSLVAAERCLFKTLMESFDVEAWYFGQSRFLSPDSRALVALDVALAEPVINLGLGGPSVPIGTPGKRDLTEIDVAIVNVLLSMICAEMNGIWMACRLHSEFESELSPANAGRLFPPTENLLSLVYEMRIGSVEGTFQIAFSTAVSDVILREIERQDSQRVQSPATRRVIEERLGKVEQPITLRLPGFKVRASELMALEVGTVLRTPLGQGSPFSLAVAHGPTWTALPVVVENRIAARVA